MIAKTFEWYRIVSMSPGSQVIADRTQAATNLIAEIDEQGANTILGMLQGLARDFSGKDAESSSVDWLLKKLKGVDPAISETLSENRIELKCIAAITIGEVFFRAREKRSELADVIAACFISSMSIRPLPQKRHLADVLSELIGLAFLTIEKTSARNRRHVIVLDDEQEKPTTLPAAIEALSKLHKQVEAINRNAEIDREEIDLFWFIASGFSRKKGQQFASMPPSVSAIHAALEVADFMLMPPPPSCYEILSSLVEAKRNPEDLQPISIAEHVAAWTRTEVDRMIGSEQTTAESAENFPVLFPLTWLALRARQLSAAPTSTEIYRNTGLRAERQLTASQVSRQLLSERVAMSLINDVFVSE